MGHKELGRPGKAMAGDTTKMWGGFCSSHSASTFMHHADSSVSYQGWKTLSVMDGWGNRSQEGWCGGKLAQRQEGGREEREKQRPRARRDLPRAPFSLRLSDPSLSAAASSGNSTKGHSAIWLPRALSFPAGHSLAFSHKLK